MQSRLTGLVLFFLISLLNSGQADTPTPPYAYKRVTKNGKYIFVMVTRVQFDPEKLTEKYAASGLYLNDGSTDPLWKVNWYAHAGSVNVSSDGKHLAKQGEWPQIGDQGTSEAVTFYKSGTHLKGYSIKDLVPKPETMPKSVSHYHWYQLWKFDDERNRLTIETVGTPDSPSKNYIFDMTTGETVKE